MTPTPPEPGTPEDWLRFAESDLALASVTPPENVLRDSLCFHAQQAAEKALKAVLVRNGVQFPRTHSLQLLLSLLPATVALPPSSEDVVRLTDYAFLSRYPGDFEEATIDEWRSAIDTARRVVRWARASIQAAPPTS